MSLLRSTPEFVLAYLFLQLWGPSMLPAIVALALRLMKPESQLGELLGVVAIGGAVGNLVDRIRTRGVIDFIELTIDQVP